jgi:hypothetical protein
MLIMASDSVETRTKSERRLRFVIGKCLRLSPVDSREAAPRTGAGGMRINYRDSECVKSSRFGPKLNAGSGRQAVGARLTVEATLS